MRVIGMSNRAWPSLTLQYGTGPHEAAVRTLVGKKRLHVGRPAKPLVFPVPARSLM